MPPDFEEPIVLRKAKGGFSIEAAVSQIHRELLGNFKEGIVWGKSVKYSPQKCGLSHILCDEDVLQIQKKNK
jgi:ribosome-interacting GTPase 1